MLTRVTFFVSLLFFFTGLVPYNYVLLTQEEDEEEEEEEEEEEKEKEKEEEEKEEEETSREEQLRGPEKDTKQVSSNRRREWRSDSVPYSLSPNGTEQVKNDFQSGRKRARCLYDFVGRSSSCFFVFLLVFPLEKNRMIFMYALVQFISHTMTTILLDGSSSVLLTSLFSFFATQHHTIHLHTALHDT